LDEDTLWGNGLASKKVENSTKLNGLQAGCGVWATFNSGTQATLSHLIRAENGEKQPKS
jgi:hypothetical protein